MTDGNGRTGAARDVPPPRPVPAPPTAPTGEPPLARAARAVAEAVAEAVAAAVTGRPDGGAAPGGAGDPGTARPAAGLGDVLGALGGVLGGVLGGALGGREGPPSASATPGGAERNPSALLGDLLATAAPRLPIRSAEALRAAHPGADDEEIADALVARAARVTAGIGAATGGLSAAHWLAPASLLALPLELGAETVLVAGIELVLIGELHELYGRPARGDARARAAAYLRSWSAQRSIDGTSGLGALLGTAGVQALRRRVTRRLARSTSSAAPLLVGAALGSRTNRRATEELAERIRADLRHRRA